MYYDAPIYKDRPTGTLCWFCMKSGTASAHGCSWNNSFTPVEGWDAIPTVMPTGKEGVCKSFCVLKCPEFLFLDGSGRYDSCDPDWRRLKHDDGSYVYEKIFENLIVTREV